MGLSHLNSSFGGLATMQSAFPDLVQTLRDANKLDYELYDFAQRIAADQLARFRQEIGRQSADSNSSLKSQFGSVAEKSDNSSCAFQWRDYRQAVARITGNRHAIDDIDPEDPNLPPEAGAYLLMYRSGLDIHVDTANTQLQNASRPKDSPDSACASADKVQLLPFPTQDRLK